MTGDDEGSKMIANHIILGRFFFALEVGVAKQPGAKNTFVITGLHTHTVSAYDTGKKPEPETPIVIQKRMHGMSSGGYKIT